MIKKILFTTLQISMLLFILSCKTTSKPPLEYLGFWAFSSSAYLELKENRNFEFMWGNYTENKQLTGIYEIDVEKKDLKLYMKNTILIWKIELSTRGWIIFLKDLQSYKYPFYKTDKADYFLHTFQKDI